MCLLLSSAGAVPAGSVSSSTLCPWGNASGLYTVMVEGALLVARRSDFVSMVDSPANIGVFPFERASRFRISADIA